MRTSIITTLILLFAFNIVFADGNDSKAANDALILKMTAKAEAVKDGNWKALANCAKTLLDKRINTEEELTWLEKSVSINRNYYNLTLLGDYYRLNFEFTKAYENYIDAIKDAQHWGKMGEIPGIQWKILMTMGTKHYYDYSKENINNN